MSGDIEKNIAIVRGMSMLPLLKTGDVVRLRPISRETIHRGDIIVFSPTESHAIIHRVISTSPLQTMGENNTTPDEPVPDDVPLFCASHVLIDGRPIQLKQGRIGWYQFGMHRAIWHIRNRFFRKWINLLHCMAKFFPWLTPFSDLTHTTFQEKDVYYRGKKAVGWLDAEGWHWIGRSWLLVKAPKKTEIKIQTTDNKLHD